MLGCYDDYNMLFLRYLGISLLTQLALWISFVMLLRFILPDKTPVLIMSFGIWITAFIISLFFASWAFSSKLPGWRDSLALLLMRLLLSMSFWLSYGLIISVRGPWVLISPEILIQIAVECLAIPLAAYRIRRRKIRSALGEGMAE